jgi:hypothetical protein
MSKTIVEEGEHDNMTPWRTLLGAFFRLVPAIEPARGEQERH